MRSRALVAFCVAAAACTGRTPPPAVPHAHSVLLITIDTLRADHVGAYGWTRARTPTLDRLARDGVRFDRAFAAAPITLPSHATILTGRYPPGHGSRDNGMAISPQAPTLADLLQAAGLSTAAFVAAFPLNHQFGLARGFQLYSDRLPRGTDGRPANERPAADVANEAIAWLQSHRNDRFFAWVHFFEPHAPYGSPSSPADAARPAIDRYDDEIAIADREAGRVIDALGPATGDTAIVVAGDHGEAFGEHGEFAHSIFVYDTTLRVPLIVRAPDGASGVVIAEPVTLADVAPTLASLAGAPMHDVDGIDLRPALSGRAPAARELYAESFAPLVEFGWAPLRVVRDRGWKLIAAPRPELYDVANDPNERDDLAARERQAAARLDQHVARYSAPSLPPSPLGDLDREAAARLRALGYATPGAAPVTTVRPDPKDRRELAARIAQVTSGELSGAALVSALEAIVRDDPRNGQARLRLGYARIEQHDCARAEVELARAIDAGLQTSDAYLGLATCRGSRNDLAGAEAALETARRLEPDNPAVEANLGILLAAKNDLPGAIDRLTRALALDPDLLEARFNLALAYARAGRRPEAAAVARELLARLPASAPQRAEVERLLRNVVP